MSKRNPLAAALLTLGAVVAVGVGVGAVLLNDQEQNDRREARMLRKQQRLKQYAREVKAQHDAKHALALLSTISTEPLQYTCDALTGIPLSAELCVEILKGLTIAELLRLKQVSSTWQELIHEFITLNPDHLRACALRGFVPRSETVKMPQVRYWQALSGSDSIRVKASSGEGESKVYTALKTSAVDPTVRIQIDKDCFRTTSHHGAYADPSLATQALSNVLTAYAAVDPTVGYCQGMNYLAAFLCGACASEEEAYWLFFALLKKDKYMVRELYLPGLPGWTQLKLQLDLLLKNNLPLIHAHFKTLDFPEDALSEWFLTLYTQNSAPQRTTGRIFDLLIVQGKSALLLVALAILKHRQTQVLQCDFEELFALLKAFPTEDELSGDDLLRMTSEFKI
jgi:hypothetical protein